MQQTRSEQGLVSVSSETAAKFGIKSMMDGMLSDATEVTVDAANSKQKKRFQNKIGAQYETNALANQEPRSLKKNKSAAFKQGLPLPSKQGAIQV